MRSASGPLRGTAEQEDFFRVFELLNRRRGVPSGAAALIILVKRWVTILDHILNTTVFNQKY